MCACAKIIGPRPLCDGGARHGLFFFFFFFFYSQLKNVNDLYCIKRSIHELSMSDRYN